MNTVPFDGEFRFLRNCSMPERKEHYELKDRVQYEHAVTKLTADLVDVRNDHGGIILVNSTEDSGNLSKSQRVLKLLSSDMMQLKYQLKACLENPLMPLRDDEFNRLLKRLDKVKELIGKAKADVVEESKRLMCIMESVEKDFIEWHDKLPDLAKFQNERAIFLTDDEPWLVTAILAPLAQSLEIEEEEEPRVVEPANKKCKIFSSSSASARN